MLKRDVTTHTGSRAICDSDNGSQALWNRGNQQPQVNISFSVIVISYYQILIFFSPVETL